MVYNLIDQIVHCFTSYFWALRLPGAEMGCKIHYLSPYFYLFMIVVHALRTKRISINCSFIVRNMVNGFLCLVGKRSSNHCLCSFAMTSHDFGHGIILSLEFGMNHVFEIFMVYGCTKSCHYNLVKSRLFWHEFILNHISN